MRLQHNLLRQAPGDARCPFTRFFLLPIVLVKEIHGLTNAVTIPQTLNPIEKYLHGAVRVGELFYRANAELDD
jgi:hypothetical protein